MTCYVDFSFREKKARQEANAQKMAKNKMDAEAAVSWGFIG